MARKARISLAALLATIGLISVGAAPPAVAHTVPDDTLSCVFTGWGDFEPSVPVIGLASGRFAFDGPATCVHADVDGANQLNHDEVNDTGVHSGYLYSSGDYFTANCNTAMNLDGDSRTRLMLEDDTEGPITNLRYFGSVAGGTGRVSFSSADSAAGYQFDPMSTGLVGNGAISIKPEIHGEIAGGPVRYRTAQILQRRRLVHARLRHPRQRVVRDRVRRLRPLRRVEEFQFPSRR